MARSYIFLCTIIASSLLQIIHAQLLSCQDVGCPRDHNDNPTCSVRGKSFTRIGVTSFNTSLTEEALIWTVAYVFGDEGVSVDHRSYYLGVPPVPDLGTINDLTGCVLFFNGIEAGLSFFQPRQSSEGLSDEQTSGTCADDLTTTCVVDLMQQAGNLTQALWRNGTFSCAAFGQALQNAPPTNCTLADTWGNITAIEITGTQSPSKIELQDCKPTTNQTFDLREIASLPEIFPHNYLTDVTPVLTAFVPSSNPSENDVGPYLALPEIHLSCMKPIEPIGKNQVISGAVDKSGLGFGRLFHMFALSLCHVLS